MKLIQKEIITEKKTRHSDGKVIEKTTVHKDVFLDGTTVPFYANLNEDTVIEVSGNIDGDEDTLTPEGFYCWVQNRTTEELPFFQAKIETQHDDGEFFYEYAVSIGWDSIKNPSDVFYTLYVNDFFRMTPIFLQSFNSLHEIVEYLTKNLDHSTRIYNPSASYINRSCRITINNVDVTNCFYRVDDWKITSQETDTSSTLTVEGNYFDERIRTEHLYAIDSQNHYHHLYSRSIQINPHAKVAKQIVHIGDNKHQYEYDSERKFLTQACSDFEGVEKTELQAHLAGKTQSPRVLKLLSENHVDEEIVGFCTVEFDVHDNFPWITTRTITKDSDESDVFFNTDVYKIIRTPYPQCVYLD